MLSMPWFLLVPIAKACPTRKRYAGSTRPVALSLTLWLSSPSSPSRNQKCHQSSPPPARRFPPPCKHTSPVRGGVAGRAGQIQLAGRGIRKPVKLYIELG